MLRDEALADHPEKAANAVRKIPIFNVPLAEVDYGHVVRLVNAWLDDYATSPLTIDAINTMGMVESVHDRRMRNALLTYDLVVPDGMPLVWCMNAKGANLDDRVYGPYLAERVLAGLARPTDIAVIGGYGEVHEWLTAAGRTRFPNANFTLLYDAPPGEIDEAYVADCIERIKRSTVHLVFVCLGVPRQYHWTALARPSLEQRVCLSVGGAFDLISGQRRYAPAWMQRAGLTWLYRLAQEPRRLGPRYFRYNLSFLWLLATREVLARMRPRASGQDAAQ